MDAWTFSSPRADGSACIARGSTYQPCLPVKGSASRKSTRAFGSSASCTTISGTSTWSRRLCNPSTTRSARGCHLCLRYDLSPMCPGWTNNVLAERVGFEPTIRLPVCRISSAVLSTAQPPLRGRRGAPRSVGRYVANTARRDKRSRGPDGHSPGWAVWRDRSRMRGAGACARLSAAAHSGRPRSCHRLEIYFFARPIVRIDILVLGWYIIPSSLG